MIKPRFRPVLGFVAVCVCGLWAGSGLAACAERDSLVKKLTRDYSERLTVGGLQKAHNGQAVLEIWSSSETGTYTILLTDPYGISCIIATGTDFFEIAPDQQIPGTRS